MEDKLLPRQLNHVSCLPKLCYAVAVDHGAKPKEHLACSSHMKFVVKCIRFAMLLVLIGV